MRTLRPEELVEIIRIVYGSNPATWPHTLPTFAERLEAELPRRWFAEPVAWIGDGNYHTQDQKIAEELMCSGRSVSPVYAAPQEQER